jgi:hypothetical protein
VNAVVGSCEQWAIDERRDGFGVIPLQRILKLCKKSNGAGTVGTRRSVRVGAVSLLGVLLRASKRRAADGEREQEGDQNRDVESIHLSTAEATTNELNAGSSFLRLFVLDGVFVQNDGYEDGGGHGDHGAHHAVDSGADQQRDDDGEAGEID